MTLTETDNRRILVIDDNESIHADFRKILAASASDDSRIDALESELFGHDEPGRRGPCYELQSALQGQEGYRLVNEAVAAGAPFALAFVDMRMPPGWDGVQTIERCWKTDPDLQIVICTAYSDYSWAEVTRRLGQTDRLLLLKKPFDSGEVWQLAATLTQKWNLSRQARTRLSQTERLADELKSTIHSLNREIDDRKVIECQLRHYAYFDALTGLPNRACLMQSLQECLNRTAREPDYRFAALFLDLDNFKLVNDSFGHECGDMLLLEMANRLRISLRTLDTIVRLENDTAARIGGDEFVIVLEGVRRECDAIAIAERLLEQLAEPLAVRSQVFNLGVSIGIAFGDKSYPSADDLLRDADTAMYRAKAAGKSRYAVFDTAMHVATRERLELENDLRRAIDERRFQLAYQPIVELASGRIVAFEALVRWDDATRKTGPDQFIPVSEETGLIVPLGQIILEDACQQAAIWNPPGAQRGVSLNINVSRRQLLETDFASVMRAVVGAVGVSPSLLNLEITETAVIDNVETATERLGQLKKLGLGLQLDDFGTGYSSLSCLHRFPLDIVKIDRSFTATLSQNHDYAAIIRAIVSLAHTLKMRVTVEGVETAEQLNQIRELGCDYAQGYYLARPLTAAAATELLEHSGGILAIGL